MPLVLAVVASAIIENGRGDFYLKFALGLLFVTTPMFTFFIAFMSIIINYFYNASSWGAPDDMRIQLFA
jgi:hypothetical protein